MAIASRALANSVLKGAGIGSALDVVVYIMSFAFFGGPHGPAGPMWVVGKLNGIVASQVGELVFSNSPGPGDGFVVGGLIISFLGGCLYGAIGGLVISAALAAKETAKD